MRVLLIGGTGVISSAVSARAVQKGFELFLLNRGNRTAVVPKGAKEIIADIHDEAGTQNALKDQKFDIVADFIGFSPADVERDYRLFRGKTKQYIFISSASAYQKPLTNPRITESTPLANPFWKYSRGKIACEEFLMAQYREEGFPVTIIRPSHTYGNTAVPVAIHGKNGSFSVLERIRTGRKVIVPGDGSSLWTVTHNTDFAKAFVGIMGNIHALGETYQITSDESLTWNQIYEIIGSALGIKPRVVHIPSDALALLSPEFRGSLLGDKSNTVLFDNTKIKKAVPDFTATVRFDQGVRQSVAYIYSHPECQKKDPAFDAWCDAVIAAYENCIANLPKYQ
ncbi:MAG: SDR family oxidoreductase [Oscillospiraceae bacterium]|nr:SDR family oxidoreductase [Oscillospiraceae bacterium]